MQATHLCSLMCFSSHNCFYKSLLAPFSGNGVVLIKRKSLLNLHRRLLSQLDDSLHSHLQIVYENNKQSNIITNAFVKVASKRVRKPFQISVYVFLLFCPLPIFMGIWKHTHTHKTAWLYFGSSFKDDQLSFIFTAILFQKIENILGCVSKAILTLTHTLCCPIWIYCNLQCQ